MHKNLKKLAMLAAGITCAVTLAGCGDKAEAGKYTYNTYLSTKPSTWNVHDWESSDEGYITSFTEIGFYDCILDKELLDTTGEGKYKFVTEMASEMPIMITSEDLTRDEQTQIIEQYDYPTSIGSNMIWDIKLNQEADWEDGTPITADDYVQSMKYQLDPDYVNFRADSYYASTLVLANAEKYFKSGRSTVEPLYNYIQRDTGEFNRDGVATNGTYYINLGRFTPYVASIFSNATNDTYFYNVLDQIGDTAPNNVRLAAQRIIDGFCYYILHYIDHSNEENHDDWEDAEKPSDVTSEMMNYDVDIKKFDRETVYVRKNVDDSSIAEANQVVYSSEDLKDDLNTFVRFASSGINHNKAYLLPLFGLVKNEEFTDFEKVGIKKIDDYTIRLFLTQHISLLDLKFALAGNWLVKNDLYEELTVTTAGVKATSYATKNVKNYKSYGPYKLTKYEEGKSFLIEKNEEWYGYSDGKHEGQFQMTGIKTTVIEDHNRVRSEFEKGNLDDFAMDRSDMETYGNSSRRTVTYESYTQKISFNSNRSKLLESQGSAQSTNKTILANDNFRKGLSLALNRNQFAATTTAGSKAFTGLLNDLYLTDAEIGEMYRQTEQGLSVYNKVYGNLGGDPYAADVENPDDFVANNTTPLAESQNGYNLAMATYFVKKGIEEELASTAEGSLKANDTISLEIRVYDDTAETTIAMTKFISDCFNSVIAAAAAKIDAENTSPCGIKFSLKTQKDEDYYNTAKTGGYDMIFSTWGGAAINPYGLMQVYCDPDFESTCEYGFKGQQGNTMLDIDLDGNGQIDATSERKSFQGWYSDITENVIEPDLDGVDRDDPANESIMTNYFSKHNQRLTILAGLEAGILNRFEAVPLVARGTSSLNSLKVENASPTYINLVGYGGVRFMTFNFDDKEWAEFIKSDDYSADLYMR